MELKTNYQYTYFIHPFIIKENKYQKYILKLLKDKRFKMKVFDKNKDIELYKYFSPKTANFLFSGFSHSKSKLEKLAQLPDDTKSAVLSKYPCVIFESLLEKDIQGKNQEKGIFFKIQKLELICFNTGICFLIMKTNVENSQSFSDILNFNYKFRDIRQGDSLQKFDKIFLQTDTFSNVNKLAEFIKDITGSDIEAMKLDIDTQRFLTYSYVCIDSSNWNTDRDFEKIEHYFIKYANFLSSDDSISLNGGELTTISDWQFAKLGITKQGLALFTSNANINNFTDLPNKFENEYFYTYILNLYKKIYLKKLEAEFRSSTNLKRARKKFIDFTKNLWIQEITDNEIGSSINYKIGKVFEIDRLYNEIKVKYDILYKELNIEKNSKSIIVVAIILVVSLIFNILSYVEIIK